MITAEQVSAQMFGHLGIVAATIDKLGIVEKIYTSPFKFLGRQPSGFSLSHVLCSFDFTARCTASSSALYQAS